MSLLEAMSAKQAVVASKVGGIPDIIQPGKNGLLVDAGDVTQLEQAFRDLFSQPDYAQQIAEQAVDGVHQIADAFRGMFGGC